MLDEPDPKRLARLEERLAARRGKAPEARAAGAQGWSQGEVAWRMVIELVAGLLLGGAIGYGLDWLFGTRPILLVLFILLGFAAGIRTMLGTAGEMRKAHEAAVAAGTVPPAQALRRGEDDDGKDDDGQDDDKAADDAGDRKG